MEAGRAKGSVRDQGYTMAIKSIFANEADVKFYETKCEAHQVFKDYLKKNAPVQGLMAVYFAPEVSTEA